MMDRLGRLYSEVVRAVLVTYQMNAVTVFVGPIAQQIPVIPGVFPGEAVTLTYFMEGGERTVTVSAPTALTGLGLEVGPFPAPDGDLLEVPQAVRDLLEQFARTGPERLQGRFRELVKELFRAGVTADEVRDEVGTALAESVMES